MDAMREYISDDEYEINDEHAGLCFFVEINQEGSKYDVKLWYDDLSGQSQFALIPYQVNDAADPNTQVPLGGTEQYTENSYG